MTPHTIIGIAGKKGSGKDTVYKIIHNLLYKDRLIKRISFADAVKYEVAQACDVTILFIEENKEKFRPMLQWWGTDFRRRFTSSDYWVKQWNLKINNFFEWHNNQTTIIITPDVRFLNEIQAIKDAGGVIWHVEIVDKPSVINDDTDKHASETQLNYTDNFDATLQNRWNHAEQLIIDVKKELIKLKLI